MAEREATVIELPTNYTLLTRTQRQDVREQYEAAQNGDCYYCGEPLHGDPPGRIVNLPIRWGFFPEGFLNHPVHLQHDHETGMTEGAVHARCNAVMWQYEGK